MKFGLVGTGFWATDVHAVALRDAPNVEFVGVWGRDADRAAEVARQFEVEAFAELDALFDAVEAVSFAVPPDAQAPLATRAAAAGKHLLLEKPVAVTGEDLSALVSAVDQFNVASAVNFSRLFTPEGQEWLAALRRSTWDIGNARWLAANFVDSSKFDTPWRRERGGLWDVGPHVVALLTVALGRITKLHATAGLRDIVHLTFVHVGGATSTATVSISASPNAIDTSLHVFGPSGHLAMPAKVTHSSVAAQVVLRQLIERASSAPVNADTVCDVHFGAYVTEVLLRAEEALSSS